MDVLNFERFPSISIDFHKKMMDSEEYRREAIRTCRHVSWENSFPPDPQDSIDI